MPFGIGVYCFEEPHFWTLFFSHFYDSVEERFFFFRKKGAGTRLDVQFVYLFYLYTAELVMVYIYLKLKCKLWTLT